MVYRLKVVVKAISLIIFIYGVVTLVSSCQSPNANIGLSDICDTKITVEKVCK